MGLVGSQASNRNNYELYVLNAYVFLNDTFLWNVTDGEVWAPHNTDEYRQGLIELNKWYKEGLISPLSYSIKEHAEHKALIETPELYKVAGWFGHPTLVTNSGTEIGVEYQGYSALQDETGSGLGGYWPRLASVKITTTTAISATCEHPELAFALLDYIAGEPYTIRVKRYGEEGVNWERLDPEVVKAENLVTSAGKPAGMKIIKDEWSEETTKTWHTGLLNCEVERVDEIPGYISGTASKPNPKARGAISNLCYDNAIATGEPAQTFKNPVYTADEQEVIDTYEAGYTKYMKQARAEFITGAKDPSDDAQWSAYLKELEANGLEELLEVAQTVWTRMNG
jgi:putative aldouronate transport system substrate-binding protein